MTTLGTRTSRMPDDCPAHPGSRAVRTVTSGTASENPEIRHRLTQYRCAEEGCTEYLGWHFQGPEGEFQHGKGSCRDTEPLGRMEMAEFREWRSSGMLLAGAVTAVVVIGTSLATLAWLPGAAPAVIPAIIAGGAAFMWWANRKILGQRPEASR